MRLKNKAIVIPGAATGIGRATAVCCAQEGARLVLGDVNEAEGRRTVELVEQVGGSGLFVNADVSVEADVVRLISEAEKWLGAIDVLIHVAGIFRALRVQVNEVEESVWNEVIDVNLKGPFLTAKHVVPIMRKAGKGVIIIVASGAGVKGGSASVPYGSSKGGAHGLSLVLASHLEQFNIRVNGFAPGTIATNITGQGPDEQIAQHDRDFLEAATQAMKNLAHYQEERDTESMGKIVADLAGRWRHLGDPEGVGRVLAFLASDEAEYVRGTIFTK